jgi:signal peptidase I
VKNIQALVLTVSLLGVNGYSEEQDYFHLKTKNDPSAGDVLQGVVSYYNLKPTKRNRRNVNAPKIVNVEPSKAPPIMCEEKPLHKFTVISESMVPAIPVGSQIYADETVQFNSVNEGDIIVYRSKDSTSGTHYVVHRVHSKNDDYIICKGDHNSTLDKERVTPSNFVGVVSKIDKPMMVGAN